jgi:hypothetical protein
MTCDSGWQSASSEMLATMFLHPKPIFKKAACTKVNHPMTRSTANIKDPVGLGEGSKGKRPEGVEAQSVLVLCKVLDRQ